MLKELNSSELIFVSGGFGFRPGRRPISIEDVPLRDPRAPGPLDRYRKLGEKLLETKQNRYRYGGLF